MEEGNGIMEWKEGKRKASRVDRVRLANFCTSKLVVRQWAATSIRSLSGGKGQQVLLGKGRVAFQLAVQADADDFSPKELEFDKVIAKTACACSVQPGSDVVGKIQHQPAATNLAQICAAPVLICQPGRPAALQLRWCRATGPNRQADRCGQASTTGSKRRRPPTVFISQNPACRRSVRNFTIQSPPGHGALTAR